MEGILGWVLLSLLVVITLGLVLVKRAHVHLPRTGCAWIGVAALGTVAYAVYCVR